VFADLDETIRLLLIRHVPLNLSEVDVSFDAPDREWSGRLSRPTVNCFLYDVRENEDLREVAWDLSRDMANGTVTRKKLPLRFNATYNVTVWARAPEDEHRLLWRVLCALVRNPVLPEDMVQGALADQPFDIPARVARPEQSRTNPADLWQALDNRIRPSLTYVTTVALDPEVVFIAPVTLTTSTRLQELQLVAGFVRARGKSSPVAGARVLLRERGAEVITGPDGRFAFQVPAGTLTLVVEAPGRTAVSISAEVPSPSYDLEV
jgi:uncharacterized protein DUF4255/carboxypeptidase family protein